MAKQREKPRKYTPTAPDPYFQTSHGSIVRPPSNGGLKTPGLGVSKRQGKAMSLRADLARRADSAPESTGRYTGPTFDQIRAERLAAWQATRPH